MDCQFAFKPSTLNENRHLLEEYFASLASPMDSYMEDHVDQSESCLAIYACERHIGFALLQQETLWFFYVQKPYLKHAEPLFDQLIHSHGIKSVYFQTCDELLTSLVMDWEIEKTRAAFFFQDAVRLEKPDIPFDNLCFRLATSSDIPLILQETGDFFETLEKDVDEGRIYVLLSGDELLGCGLLVPGRYFKNCISLGMIACERYRRKGIGRLVLWYLKELCYAQGKIPLAGCGYWNRLSRKTLESAGLVTRARGMRAKLLRKAEAVRA